MSDVLEYRVCHLENVKTIRVFREESLKTFFEKFRDVFGEDFPVEKIETVYQEFGDEIKFIYNNTDPSNRNLRRIIEYCSDLDQQRMILMTFQQENAGEKFMSTSALARHTCSSSILHE